MSAPQVSAPLLHRGMPWHQLTARAFTWSALVTAPILGPFTAAGYLITTLGH
jgi:hypothetical protein